MKCSRESRESEISPQKYISPPRHPDNLKANEKQAVHVACICYILYMQEDSYMYMYVCKDSCNVHVPIKKVLLHAAWPGAINNPSGILQSFELPAFHWNT